MRDSEILAELEDLLRTMPPRATLRHNTEENFAWFGRARSIVCAWNGMSSVLFGPYVEAFIGSMNALVAEEAFAKLMTILHEARWDLRMRTTGPISIAVNRGQPFDYFDEVRRYYSALGEEKRQTVNLTIPARGSK